MTIALYIGAACACLIGGIFAALMGVSYTRREPLDFWTCLFVWLICAIGAAAMLVAGVKA